MTVTVTVIVIVTVTVTANVIETVIENGTEAAEVSVPGARKLRTDTQTTMISRPGLAPGTETEIAILI